MHDDCRAMFHRDPENQVQYAATGLATNMLSNRVSWFFNFTGPSVTLDTACSISRPGLDEQGWGSLLRNTGFSGPDIVINDYENDQCNEHSAIISTAVGSYKDFLNPHTVLIVVSKDSVLQLEVGKLLQSDLQKASSTDCKITSLSEASQVENLQQCFCIFLLELEISILSNLDQTAFLALQRVLLSVTGLLWITRGGGEPCFLPEHAMIYGVGRVLRQENRNVESHLNWSLDRSVQEKVY